MAKINKCTLLIRKVIPPQCLFVKGFECLHANDQVANQCFSGIIGY